MATQADMTVRTVERQLVKARRSLRLLERRAAAERRTAAAALSGHARGRACLSAPCRACAACAQRR